MLVRFVSSETGEVLMYANVAKVRCRPWAKKPLNAGAFLPAQMLPAAQACAIRWRAQKRGSRSRERRSRREGKETRWSHCGRVGR